MNKLYSKSLALLALASAPALSAQIPEDLGFSDYRGDSFTANWSGSLDNGKLNVFTLSDKYVTGEADFSCINATDGKIDSTNPNYPAGWTVSVNSDGETDIIDGAVLLDEDGEYVELQNVPGYITGFDIYFKVRNASETSSSVFRFEYYNNAGVRMANATIYLSTLASYEHVDVMAYTSLSSTDFTSARVVLSKSDGQEGDLVIEKIKTTYRSYDYVYQEPVTESPVTVTGLDPELAYYMYLSQGDTQGYQVTVDPILTPETDTPSDITEGSYTARWKYVPKAAGYEVTNYRIEEMSPGEPVSVFHETFSKADQGTVDDPVSIDDPNDYADVTGWSGRNFIMAEGMVGASKGAFPRNISYLWTPSLNLAGADGKYNVRLKAYGTPGDNLNLYRDSYYVDDALNIHSETFDANGVIDATWTMDDGADDMIISIEESALKAFLIDEIEITQTYESATLLKDVFLEEFSKADQGTVDDPVSIDDPNDYADVTGWSGKNFIMAEGMVGASKGSFPRNISYLWTPSLNLAAADGKYTVSLKAYGTPGDNLNLYRDSYLVDDALNIHSETFDENGVIDATWTMDDGADDMIISIEESALKAFLIDRLAISQEFEAGSTISIPLSTVTVEGGNVLSYTFTDLTPGESYGYDLKAYRSDESTSERSDMAFVALTIASVESVEAELFDVMSIEGNLIHTSFAAPTTVTVYDINGRVVESIVAPAGHATLSLSAAPGVYVISAPGNALKARLR